MFKLTYFVKLLRLPGLKLKIYVLMYGLQKWAKYAHLTLKIYSIRYIKIQIMEYITQNEPLST